MIRLAKFSDDALSEKIPYVMEGKRWAIYEQQAEKMGFGSRNTILRKISFQLSQFYQKKKLDELELSLKLGSSPEGRNLANHGLWYINDAFVNLLMLTSLFQTTEEYISKCLEK
ncbi:MAG: hypothetical protein ACXVA0_24630 [Mucilaginibacter sp.]